MKNYSTVIKKLLSFLATTISIFLFLNATLFLLSFIVPVIPAPAPINIFFPSEISNPIAYCTFSDLVINYSDSCETLRTDRFLLVELFIFLGSIFLSYVWLRLRDIFINFKGYKKLESNTLVKGITVLTIFLVFAFNLIYGVILFTIRPVNPNLSQICLSQPGSAACKECIATDMRGNLCRYCEQLITDMAKDWSHKESLLDPKCRSY